MEQHPSGFLGQWGANQKGYIQAEEDWSSSSRPIFWRRSFAAAPSRCRVSCGPCELCDSWLNTLAIGFDSLYGASLRGQKKLVDVLKEQTEVKVRRILPASDEAREEYLNELMAKYAEELQDGLASILGDFTWGLDRRRQGGRDTHGLSRSSFRTMTRTATPRARRASSTTWSCSWIAAATCSPMPGSRNRSSSI